MGMSIFVKVLLGGTNQQMKLEVDINDKIAETLADVSDLAFNKSGRFFANNSLVGEDDTFQAKNIQDGCKILQVTTDAGCKRIVPIPWRRSKDCQNESYTSASANCYDALKFRARTSLTVYGFMWNQEYNKKDFTLKFSYRVNNEPWSEEEEVSRTPDEIVTEDKYHFIDF